MERSHLLFRHKTLETTSYILNTKISQFQVGPTAYFASIGGYHMQHNIYNVDMSVNFVFSLGEVINRKWDTSVF